MEYLDKRTALWMQLGFLAVIAIPTVLFFEGLGIWLNMKGAGVIFGTGNNLADWANLFVAMFILYAELWPLMQVLIGRRPSWKVWTASVFLGWGPDALTNILEVTQRRSVFPESMGKISPEIVLGIKIVVAVLICFTEVALAFTISTIRDTWRQLRGQINDTEPGFARPAVPQRSLLAGITGWLQDGLRGLGLVLERFFSGLPGRFRRSPSQEIFMRPIQRSSAPRQPAGVTRLQDLLHTEPDEEEDSTEEGDEEGSDFAFSTQPA